MKRLVLLSAFVLTLTGCPFTNGSGPQTPEPGTPDEEISLSMIHLGGSLGCDILRREEPDDARVVLAIMKGAIQPLIDSENPETETALEELVGDYSNYIAPGLRLFRAYVIQRGAIDLDDFYWKAIRELVTGCVQALEVQSSEPPGEGIRAARMAPATTK